MKNMLTSLAIVVCCIASLSCRKEAALPVGSILLVNNSSNPYDVYINGKLEVPATLRQMQPS